MTMQASAQPGGHFRRGWVYVLMLALVTINYMDRSALGIVAQAVRGEFKLVAGRDGLFVLVVPLDLCALPPADRHPARPLRPAQHQLHRHRVVVAGDGGDRRSVELCHADCHAHGDGSRRSDVDTVLRPHRARMDAGERTRRRQRFLERRQLSRSGARRGRHRRDRQRLGMARRLRLSRRTGRHLARLQSSVVRSAGEGELAVRRRAQKDR